MTCSRHFRNRPIATLCCQPTVQCQRRPVFTSGTSVPFLTSCRSPIASAVMADICSTRESRQLQIAITLRLPEPNHGIFSSRNTRWALCTVALDVPNVRLVAEASRDIRERCQPVEACRQRRAPDRKAACGRGLTPNQFDAGVQNTKPTGSRTRAAAGAVGAAKSDTSALRRCALLLRGTDATKPRPELLPTGLREFQCRLIRTSRPLRALRMTPSSWATRRAAVELWPQSSG